MCEECLEKKKSISKIRRDSDFQELIKINHEYKEEMKKLEEELILTREKLELSEQRCDSLYAENQSLTAVTFDRQLEKENEYLTKRMAEMKAERDNMAKTLAAYEMTFSQTELDLEKYKIDNERLRCLNSYLLEDAEHGVGATTVPRQVGITPVGTHGARECGGTPVGKTGGTPVGKDIGTPMGVGKLQRSNSGVSRVGVVKKSSIPILKKDISVKKR